MYTAMERYSFAWLYFVTFVIVGTFVVINLFIAIIINSLDEAKSERASDEGSQVSREDLLREIRATQDAVKRLEEKLRRSNVGNDPAD